MAPAVSAGDVASNDGGGTNVPPPSTPVIKKSFYADVTEYICNNRDCITASGSNPSIERSASCPRSISLGTRIKVYRSATRFDEYRCEDRTAKRFDGRFDIFNGYGEYARLDSLRWGRQRRLITILD